MTSTIPVNMIDDIRVPHKILGGRRESDEILRNHSALEAEVCKMFERPEMFSYFFFLFFHPSILIVISMALTRKPLSLIRHLRSHPRLNRSERSFYRGLATAAADSPTLPLAGIRVLDMTRVLAGVCMAYKTQTRFC